MISLEFDVGREDVLEFSIAQSEDSSTFRRAVNRARIVFPVLMGVTAIYYFIRDGGFAPFLFVAAGMLWAVFYPARKKRHLRKTTAALLSEPSYEKAFGHYEITLSEDGIASKSPGGESKYNWSSVDRLELTETHLNIYRNGASGYPISRSQVDDEMIFRAKEYIEAKINGSFQAS